MLFRKIEQLAFPNKFYYSMNAKEANQLASETAAKNEQHRTERQIITWDDNMKQCRESIFRHVSSGEFKTKCYPIGEKNVRLLKQDGYTVTILREEKYQNPKTVRVEWTN